MIVFLSGRTICSLVDSLGESGRFYVAFNFRGRFPSVWTYLPVSSDGALFSVGFVRTSTGTFASLSNAGGPFLPLSVVLFTPMVSGLARNGPRFVTSAGAGKGPSCGSSVAGGRR